MSNVNNSPGSRDGGKYAAANLATVQEMGGSGPHAARGGLRNDPSQTAAAIINHYMSGGKDVLGGGVGPGLDYLMSGGGGGGDDASNRYKTNTTVKVIQCNCKLIFWEIL